MKNNKIKIVVAVIAIAMMIYISFVTLNKPSQKNTPKQPITTNNAGQYSVKSGGVYSYGNLIIGADPKTFQEIGENYSKDSKNIYYDTKIVDGADQKTAVIFTSETGSNSHYLKDKNAVYLNGVKLPNVDAESFVYLGFYYSKDKNSVYFANMGPMSDPFASVKDADLKTFEVIPNWSGYAKDKNSVYSGGKPNGAKPENCTTTNISGCQK